MSTGHRFTYWQEPDGFFIGYIEDYPDYRTQGTTLDELRANLREILSDLDAGLVPCARHSEELAFA